MSGKIVDIGRAHFTDRGDCGGEGDGGTTALLEGAAAVTFPEGQLPVATSLSIPAARDCIILVRCWDKG
jgi:hypothetical protein